MVSTNCKIEQPDKELCYIKKHYPLERADSGKNQIIYKLNYRFKHFFYKNNGHCQVWFLIALLITLICNWYNLHLSYRQVDNLLSVNLEN